MRRTGPLLVTAALAAAVVVATAPTAHAEQVVFNFVDGDEEEAIQEFVVPADVCQITVDAFGADGGDTPTAPGGAGGRAQATVPVTAGQTLIVIVGGRGGDGGATPGEGGPFDGGDGGAGTDGLSGAGGGGFTAVGRLADPEPTVLLVAGAGGGAGGGDADPATGGAGGPGGGDPGGDGGDSSNAATATGGFGGGGASGATGGAGGENFGEPGGDALGGDGGNGGASPDGSGAGGGGGGEGYAGGGGGGVALVADDPAAGGGGGGSGFADPSLLDPVLTAGANTTGDGNGLVTFTFEPGSCGPTPAPAVAEPVVAAARFTG